MLLAELIQAIDCTKATPAARQPHWLSAVADRHELIALAPAALPHSALQAASEVARGRPHSARSELQFSTLASTLDALLNSLGTKPEQRTALHSPLQSTLSEILRFDPEGSAVLRLEVVHARTCPKWHVDRLRWRIACSLAGAGTEYLAPGQDPGNVAETEFAAVPTGLFCAMAGANSGAGLWHRSPHACAEHPRLFLSVDLR